MVRVVDAETVRVTGEDRAAQALAALPSDEWTVFCTPNLPHGGCPGVDHVLVEFRAASVVPGSRPPRRGGRRALRADPASPAARLARLLG